MEEMLRDRLLANSGLAALISTRLTWLIRPQKSGLPAVTLQVFSAPRDYSMSGPSDLLNYGVQADVWAGSYKDMKAVSRALVAALHDLKTPPLQAFIDNEHETVERQDGPDPSGVNSFFRTRLDCRIWFTPAA